MKLIVAGGRGYLFTAADVEALDRLVKECDVTEVVHGCAQGADRCAREWAGERQIPRTMFRADWNRYGRSAGPIRNKAMAEYGHALVAFPGGRGTADMVRRAGEQGLRVFDWRGAESGHNAPVGQNYPPTSVGT